MEKTNTAHNCKNEILSTREGAYATTNLLAPSQVSEILYILLHHGTRKSMLSFSNPASSGRGRLLFFLLFKFFQHGEKPY